MNQLATVDLSTGEILSVLKVPYLNLLPPLSTPEREALRASIEREGVRVPISVDEYGNILDGHHRYEIAPNAPRQVVSGLSEAEKMAFVISSNMHRRNLSPEQKQVLREKQKAIAKELKQDGRTQEDIAALLGVDQTTVSVWLSTTNMIANIGSSLDARIKLPPAAKVVVLDRIDAGEPQKQVAADFGISQQNVSKIAKAERKRRERELDLEAQRAAIARGELDVAAGPFDVIVVDPPWPYGTEYNAEGRRAANPYPEMSLAEIAEDGLREVAGKAADSCILFLWTTHQFMRDSFPLLDKWGFEEKVIVTWVKDKMGLGVWLRSQSEFFILATRGSPKVTLTNQTTVLNGKARQHSRKPDEFYELVNSLCPGPRRYDRFAREPRDGWHVGGNDVELFGKKAG